MIKKIAYFIFILIAIMLLIALFSCHNSYYKKPFTIINKSINYYPDKCYYEYVDVNGNGNMFFDTNEKYNIGDTIK